ncbi:MAG: TetR/AcrR family transcriptional regulator [Sphingomonas parapaucimobilis]
MGGESEQPDAEQRLLIMACLIFGMATLLMVVSVYFITTTTPEQIGEWLGRIGHSFRGAL